MIRDLILLSTHTGMCAGLYMLLWHRYTPSIGTPWEAAMVLVALLTTVALAFWVVFAGVFINTHILRR